MPSSPVRRGLLVAAVVAVSGSSGCSAGRGRPASPERGELRVSTVELVADYRRDPEGAARRWGASGDRHYLVSGPLRSLSRLPGGPFDTTMLVLFGTDGAVAGCYTLYSEGGPALVAWPAGKEVLMRTRGATVHADARQAGWDASLGSCTLVVP
jgi:hypothetical protein